jgi:hypothetical protein
MRLRMMLATLLVAAVAGTGVLAAEGTAKDKAPASAGGVQGEILDLSCYMGHGGMGEGHSGCAAKCLKGGQPMGLLATDGTVYLLFADHTDAAAFEKAKGFAGKKVEITGDVASKDGLKGITVKGVKSL